jgi:hypothetical protein
MSFNVTAVCDMCGPTWWKGYAEQAPTFASRRDALRCLPADYLWRIEEQTDGSLSMLCSACATLEDCLRHGHTWVPLEYEVDGCLQQYGEVCAVCSVVRSFDTPPAGHPDATPVGLTIDQVALLAEIDAREFPKETLR